MAEKADPTHQHTTLGAIHYVEEDRATRQAFLDGQLRAIDATEAAAKQRAYEDAQRRAVQQIAASMMHEEVTRWPTSQDHEDRQKIVHMMVILEFLALRTLHVEEPARSVIKDWFKRNVEGWEPPWRPTPGEAERKYPGLSDRPYSPPDDPGMVPYWDIARKFWAERVAKLPRKPQLVTIEPRHEWKTDTIGGDSLVVLAEDEWDQHELPLAPKVEPTAGELHQLASMEELGYRALHLLDTRYGDRKAWKGIQAAPFGFEVRVGYVFDAGWAYLDSWSYLTYDDALSALLRWNGRGEPEGWHRHPESKRRRPGGDASQEYVEEFNT